MSYSSMRNGKWGPDLQEAERYRESYARWRRGLEEAKQEGSRPQVTGRSKLLRRLSAILKGIVSGK